MEPSNVVEVVAAEVGRVQEEDLVQEVVEALAHVVELSGSLASPRSRRP